MLSELDCTIQCRMRRSSFLIASEAAPEQQVSKVVRGSVGDWGLVRASLGGKQQHKALKKS